MRLLLVEYEKEWRRHFVRYCVSKNMKWIIIQTENPA